MMYCGQRLACLLLLFTFYSAGLVSSGPMCSGEDESLPLRNEVVFEPDCQTTTATYRSLSIGHLRNNKRRITIEANVSITCFDFNGILVYTSINSNSVQVNGGKSEQVVWPFYNALSLNFYYGVSCNIFGCYRDKFGSTYFRIANSTCESYLVYDECLNSNDNNCHPDATCSNIENGTFNCTCNYPYVGNGTHCEDFDECIAEGPERHDCDINAICINTLGSFDCICMEGYTGNGSFCENIDECIDGYNNCSQLEYCEDTPGSYECICNKGYARNGSTCEDVDECHIGSNGRYSCDVNANCTNTIGSFECSCLTGYTGDGIMCESVDECQGDEDGHNCDTNAQCNNTIGSFNCSCKQGYSGDGIACQAVNILLRFKVPFSVLLVVVTMIIILVITGAALATIIWFRKHIAKKKWENIHRDGLISISKEIGKETNVYDELFKPTKLHFEEDEVSLQYYLALETNITNGEKDDFKICQFESLRDTSEGYVSQSCTSSTASKYSDKNMDIELTGMPDYKDIESFADLTRDIKEPVHVIQTQEAGCSLPYISNSNSFPAPNSTEYISTECEIGTTAVSNDQEEMDMTNVQYVFDGSSSCVGYVHNGVWPENACTAYVTNDNLSINLDSSETQERLHTINDYVQS